MLVEVNRLDATREVLEGQVEVLRLQLGTLLGLEPDAPLSVRGELLLAPTPLSREERLRQALTTRPDLLAARAEVEMAGGTLLRAILVGVIMPSHFITRRIPMTPARMAISSKRSASPPS